MKGLSLFAIVAFALAGCGADQPPREPAGSMRATPQQPADPKSEVERISVPQLQLCVLKAGPPPPSMLGSSSPSCISRLSFKPSGIAPKRSDGEFGVILKLAPKDQGKLSDFSDSFVGHGVVLLRDGTVVSNPRTFSGGAMELQITFESESESDVFFETLFAR